MKKDNNNTDMMTKTSKAPLTVFASGHQDKDGKELVIACGYANNGKFGYFICKEKVTAVGNPHDETYHYTDQFEFYPKENEHTYSAVLAKFKEIVQKT